MEWFLKIIIYGLIMEYEKALVCYKEISILDLLWSNFYYLKVPFGCNSRIRIRIVMVMRMEWK